MTHLTDTDRTVLIAEYTLGLLNQEETAQAKALLNSDPQAVVIALKWEGALLNLADRLDPAVLPDNLWQEISNTLDFDPIQANVTPVNIISTASSANTASVSVTTPVPETKQQTADPVHNLSTPTPAQPTATETAAKPLPLRPEPQSPTKIIDPSPVTLAAKHPKNDTQPSNKKQPRRAGWRRKIGQIFLASVILLAVVFATLTLIPRTPALPPVTVIEVTPKQAAILQAPGQSSTPGWVVTISPSNDVQLNPQVHTDIPEDASVQLWTYNKHSPTPRSLGLIDPNQPVTVPAALMGAIGEQQFFEMTQETAGGSVTGLPSGPVLFIGRIVTFG